MSGLRVAPEINVEPTSANNELRRVLAFEMETEGHHPGYVKNFANAWVEYKVPGYLDFVVTPKFFEQHPDAVQSVQELADYGVSIQCLSDEESQSMERISYLRYFHAWRLFCEYIERMQADHGLVMYFDFFQVPAILGRPCPTNYSGIYFRPTFHYHLMEGYRSSFRERVRAWRKKAVLRRVVAQKRLERLYCLDEIAVDYMSREFRSDTKFDHIADSFSVYESSPSRQAYHREKLGIDPDRRLFTLLGVLDRRKGVKELLACLPKISEEAASRMTLLLAGIILPSQAEVVNALTKEMQAKLNLQIILHNQYVPDCEVQHIYDTSDVILATYQGHMGSSSALIRAALAGKPVLSSDYGLMGEIVRRRSLGRCVDTSNSDAMAAALEKLALEPDLSKAFDASEAAAYAKENSPERLAADLAIMVGGNST